jgi:hypothetical protein
MFTHPKKSVHICTQVQRRRLTFCAIVCGAQNTYHSRLIPEGVAEASQLFLRDANTMSAYNHLVT